MSKGGKKQTTTVDPSSQRFIDQQRRMAQQAAGVAQNAGPLFTGPLSGEQITQAMNPFLQNVLQAQGQQFDHLRNQALTGANQQATQAGAFGGSRHGVMAGARLGELDRAQMQQTAGLLQGGFQDARQFAEHQRQLQQQQMQEPLFRQQNALQFMNMGMGPVGQVQTAPGGSPLGSAASGAMAGSAFGPWGAAIGGGIGLLGGLFG